MLKRTAKKEWIQQTTRELWETGLKKVFSEEWAHIAPWKINRRHWLLKGGREVFHTDFLVGSPRAGQAAQAKGPRRRWQQWMDRRRGVHMKCCWVHITTLTLSPSPFSACILIVKDKIPRTDNPKIQFPSFTPLLLIMFKIMTRAEDSLSW